MMIENSIKEIIQEYIDNVCYHANDVTLVHKRCSYQALSNLLNQYPTDMSNYLLGNSRKHWGVQHKLFQEYIKILEGSLPFIIIKGKTQYRVDSLLDDNLCLFDGISNFEAMVNEKLIVPNLTQEFYVGGRSSSYAKPYYLGKLLDIKNNYGISLMFCVQDYSFTKIHLRGVRPGMMVKVSHLRIPPHYGMGTMSYINRAKQTITKYLRSI
jgi:hypothetical protein